MWELLAQRVFQALRKGHIYDLLVVRGQKLGARGHWALLEHSPGYVFIYLKSEFLHNLSIAANMYVNC